MEEPVAVEEPVAPDNALMFITYKLATSGATSTMALMVAPHKMYHHPSGSQPLPLALGHHPHPHHHQGQIHPQDQIHPQEAVAAEAAMEEEARAEERRGGP